MQPFNTQTLEDLAARIGKAIEASPAADIEKNVKAMLQGGLARLDLVTREEFDTPHWQSESQLTLDSQVPT